PTPHPLTSTLFPYTTLFRSRYDLLRNLILQGKDVFQGPIIACGPQMMVRGGIDQLGRDPHLTVGLADTALQDILDPQVLAHRLRDRKSTRLNSSHVSISYAV